MEKKQIAGGMIPKIQNGFHALQNGVTSVNITSVADITNQSGTRLV